MEGVVESNVEPVVRSRESRDVLKVVHKLVERLNKTIGGVEAVRLGNGVNSGEFVVLKTVGHSVESGSEGFSVKLSVSNNGPLLVRSSLVPVQSGGLELTLVVVKTDKTLSVNSFESVLGGADLLKGSFGGASGISLKHFIKG